MTTSTTITTALAALAAAGALAQGAPAVGGPGAGRAADTGAAAYSRAAARICARALLFEGRHAIGTRDGADAVARDIRASTGRRVARLATLTPPVGQTRLAARWLVLERRLAAAFAHSYVAVYDAIDAARPAQVLGRLLHAPDGLRAAAARVERRLHVPDCTGGAPIAAPQLP